MSWFKFKSKEEIKVLACPYCKESQEVSGSVLSVICKGCKRSFRLDQIEEPKEKSTPKVKTGSSNVNSSKSQKVAPSSKEESKPKVVENKSKNPSTGKTKGSTDPVKSTVSPKQKAVNSGPNNSSASNDSSSQLDVPPLEIEDKKSVRCASCNERQDVPSIAMASFCDKCGSRINLQNYKFTSSFRGELETRGTIEVAPNATVQAKLDVGIVDVSGRFIGDIITETKAVIRDGGFISGKIESPALVVDEGGGFVGGATINPKKNMKIKEGFLGF